MRAAELIAPLKHSGSSRCRLKIPALAKCRSAIEAVGVCGSDLHAYREGAVGSTPNVYPMVLGHEPAGVIVKTGAGVSGLAAGDRGALEPALYCYHCEFCLTGHHNVCANIRFLSNPGHPGFFREVVNLPVANFRPIPANMGFDAATLAEPLAIAMHSLRLTSIRRGETVVVIGAGPIGLMTIAALRAAGAGGVWAVEPLAHRRELALAIGAGAALEPEEAIEEILIATGQRGVDCAIDCAAGAETVNQAVHACAQCGPRRDYRHPLHPQRGHGRVGNAPQRADYLQRAPLEPRDRRGSGTVARAMPPGLRRCSHIQGQSTALTTPSQSPASIATG